MAGVALPLEQLLALSVLQFALVCRGRGRGRVIERGTAVTRTYALNHTPL